MQVQQLDHFGLEVSDLQRAQRFYVEVLGMAPVARFGDLVLLRCGAQNVALHEVRREPLTSGARAELIGHPLSRAHHAFLVTREDFSAAGASFAQAGVESSAPIDWGDHDCVYFLDPDGNLLELVSYR
jgi:catechol 2,3-dioxygenase-like lactoylglutathione lyase family enzyme